MMYDKTLVRNVDEAWADMMKANEAVPYDHKEYKRHENMLEASLIMLCLGDRSLASGMMQLMLANGDQGVGYFIRNVPAEEIYQYA